VNDLGSWLANLSRPGPSFGGGLGQVTLTSPLTITMGGSTTPVGSVRKLKSYTPAIGDVVLYVRLDEAAVLVLGAVG
jgi:hypothetical protein